MSCVTDEPVCLSEQALFLQIIPASSVAEGTNTFTAVARPPTCPAS